MPFAAVPRTQTRVTALDAARSWTEGEPCPTDDHGQPGAAMAADTRLKNTSLKESLEVVSLTQNNTPCSVWETDQQVVTIDGGDKGGRL